MTWILVAFDDYTLGAVMDDARVRSLDSNSDFLLLTPQDKRWGDETAGDGERYLTTLPQQLQTLTDEGVVIAHEWIPGEDLEHEIVDTGRHRTVDGVIIAHHNPDEAFPDPEAFDDALRRDLGVALDVISLE